MIPETGTYSVRPFLPPPRQPICKKIKRPVRRIEDPSLPEGTHFITLASDASLNTVIRALAARDSYPEEAPLQRKKDRSGDDSFSKRAGRWDVLAFSSLPEEKVKAVLLAPSSANPDVQLTLHVGTQLNQGTSWVSFSPTAQGKGKKRKRADLEKARAVLRSAMGDVARALRRAGARDVARCPRISTLAYQAH